MFGVAVTAVLVLLLVTLASASRGVTEARAVTPAYPWLPAGVTPAQTDWEAPAGDLAQSNYSSLTQLNTGTVSLLKRVWQKSFEGPDFSGNVEGTGIEVSGAGKNLPLESGTLFIGAANGYRALDPTTGETLWTYAGVPAPSSASSPYASFALKAGNTPRALSYGKGRIYVGQADGSVAALNAKDGKILWTADVSAVGTFPGWVSQSQPSTVFYDDGGDGMVFCGPNFGEEPIRGHLDAYNARTGALIWRRFMTPDLKQFPQILTWSNPNEAALGGGTTWSTYAIDPGLGSIFVGTGNPYPYTGRTPGKNLWTDSVVSLNIKTGAIRWAYQTVHHDEWGYDTSGPPLLVNAKVRGKLTPIVVTAGKTGYLYALNRRNGSPIWRIPEKKVPDLSNGKGATLNVTSPTQPQPTGAMGKIIPHCMTSAQAALYFGSNFPTAPNGTPVTPTCPFAASYSDAYAAWFAGGATFWRTSYNPETNDLYVCANVNAMGRQNVSSSDWHQQLLSDGSGSGAADPDRTAATITAINMSTNRIHWKINWKPSPNGPGGCNSGVLSTAGGLLFLVSNGGPAPVGSDVYALDARNGNTLWKSHNDDQNSAPVITYKVNGKQYIAVYLEGPAPTNPAADGLRDRLTVFAVT